MPHILPESVSSPMTRPSLGYPHGGHTALNRATPEMFPVTERGLWLPPEVMSRVDLEAAQRGLASAALVHSDGYHDKVWAHVVSGYYRGVEAVEGTGCWRLHPGVPQLGTADHTTVLWSAMSLETGYRVLTPPARKADVQLCDDPECLYPRHYDIVPGLENRDRLVEPYYAAYRTRPDGSIETAWGDVLPSVADSRQALVALQRRCPPHVPRGRGPLTLSGISKIGFDPITGCWPQSTYYSRDRGEGDGVTWQYDAYGRLGLPKLLRETHGLPSSASAQKLGHRVVWLATGGRFERDDTGRWKVLNHYCGYRRCANPGHIVQETVAENISHGRRMAAAMQAIRAGYWPQETLV